MQQQGAFLVFFKLFCNLNAFEFIYNTRNSLVHTSAEIGFFQINRILYPIDLYADKRDYRQSYNWTDYDNSSIHWRKVNRAE